MIRKIKNKKSKIKNIVLLFIFSLILVCPALAKLTPRAVWATYGMVINDTQGNTSQQNPKMVGDGQGNYFVVWEDGRSGYYDIYAQKINEAGQPLWQSSGIAVCTASRNQNSPSIVSDGTGGIIVAWQDYRNGNSDIYIQKINGTGQPLWQKDGVPISEAKAGQFAPEITTDSAGGAIVAWHDYRSGSGEDIYAQRIGSDGAIAWAKDGIAVSVSQGTQWYPKIIDDSAGGAIIVWTDGRLSSADNNIYGQHLNASGQILWEKDGLAICSAKQNQERPELLKVSDGAIIAWNDSRANSIDIFAQKISFNGQLLWEKDGLAICQIAYSQANPKLASDGSGGAIITWSDERVENNDIYAQRVYNSGKLAWQENGRPVTKALGAQKKPEVVKIANQEEWIIVWEDKRNGKIDLFAQKINNAGTPLWQENGLEVAASDLEQEYSALVATGTGNVIVAWQDKRFGNFDIRGQKISGGGQLVWQKDGTVICNSPGSVVQQIIKLIFTTKQEIVILFEDARSGYFNIYAQKINSQGKLAWGQNGIAVDKSAGDQENAQVIADNSNGVIVAWEDHRDINNPIIRAQRINAAGKKVWSSNLTLSGIKSKQINPKMVPDGTGGAIIVWQDDRDVLSLQDVYGQRVSAKGELLWGKKGKIMISANGNQSDIALISDTANGAYLAWTDYRQGDRNPDIYAQRISSKGEPLWQEDGVKVCGAPDIQRAPELIGDNEGGVLISWTDKGGGSYDIYAQRINKAGKPVWMTDGIPINQLSRTQQNAQFANKNILIWEDYRYGNWDIFAGSVNEQGKLNWGEAGEPVVMASKTQYSPSIAEAKDGGVIIAWEDYRSGKQYEIFVQRINNQGEPSFFENGVRVKTSNGARAPRVITKPNSNVFYVFWEDFTGGGRAIYGQKYVVD